MDTQSIATLINNGNTEDWLERGEGVEFGWGVGDDEQLLFKVASLS